MGVLTWMLWFVQASLLFTQITDLQNWDVVQCDKDLHFTRDHVCWIWIDDLRPSQSAIGSLEIESKAPHWEEMTRTELSQYKWAHKVPTVIGPEGFQMFDHHHMVRSIWDADIPDEDEWVYVRLAYDWRDVSHKQFQYNMYAMGMLWLFDVKGLGPIDPLLLPRHVRFMQEDPFRDLSHILNQRGAFGSTIPFTEFYWANYLRKHLNGTYAQYQEYIEEDTEWCTNVRPYSRTCISKHRSRQALNAMVEPALALACDDREAWSLPGHHDYFCEERSAARDGRMSDNIAI